MAELKKVKDLKAADAAAPPKLRNIAPSEYMSDAFPQAQQTPTVQTTPYYLGEHPTKGFLGLPPQALGAYRPRSDVTQLDPNADTDVVVHEAAHAAWAKDLTPEQKAAWTALHSKNPQLVTVDNYKNDPSHSFAASMGMFASNPEYLKKTAPGVYSYLTNLGGFEYRRDLGKPEFGKTFDFDRLK